MMTALLRSATLVTFVAVTSTAGAAAQTPAVDPHHPNPTLAQAMPPSESKECHGKAGSLASGA